MDELSKDSADFNPTRFRCLSEDPFGHHSSRLSLATLAIQVVSTEGMTHSRLRKRNLWLIRVLVVIILVINSFSKEASVLACSAPDNLCFHGGTCPDLDPDCYGFSRPLAAEVSSHPSSILTLDGEIPTAALQDENPWIMYNLTADESSPVCKVKFMPRSNEGSRAPSYCPTSFSIEGSNDWVKFTTLFNRSDWQQCETILQLEPFKIFKSYRLTFYDVGAKTGDDEREYVASIKFFGVCHSVPDTCTLARAVLVDWKLGYAEATSRFNLTYEAKNAFDLESKDPWVSDDEDRSRIVWLKLPKPVKVAQFSFATRLSQAPKQFELVGSKECSDWTSISVFRADFTECEQNLSWIVPKEKRRSFRCMGIKVIKSSRDGAALRSLRMWAEPEAVCECRPGFEGESCEKYEALDIENLSDALRIDHLRVCEAKEGNEGICSARNFVCPEILCHHCDSYDSMTFKSGDFKNCVLTFKCESKKCKKCPEVDRCKDYETEIEAHVNQNCPKECEDRCPGANCACPEKCIEICPTRTCICLKPPTVEADCGRGSSLELVHCPLEPSECKANSECCRQLCPEELELAGYRWMRKCVNVDCEVCSDMPDVQLFPKKFPDREESKVCLIGDECCVTCMDANKVVKCPSDWTVEKKQKCECRD